MYRHNPQRYGVYKVKVTLQYDEYKGHLYGEDEGHGEGWELLFNASEITQYDQINSDCDYERKFLKESYDMFEAKLVNEKGETYLLNDYIYNLNDYITAIEIIECQEKELK